MIHVVQYDYSRKDQTKSGKRVGKATFYGPFDCRIDATEWAKENLINDENFEWKLLNIPGVGLV